MSETDIEEEDGRVKKKGLSGKKLVLFILLPLLLLGGGGAGAYFFLFAGSSEQGEEAAAEDKAAEEEDIAGEPVFYELPEMLINLNSRGAKKNSFLKLRLTLELRDPQAVPELEKVLPRVLDNFNTFLRELRIEELRGTAAVYRIKEELLIRINDAVRPIRVYDVLFNEMLIQ